MKRLFIALPVDDAVAKNLAGAERELAKYGNCLKMVGTGHYHITVKFLGETEDSLADELLKAFQHLRGMATAYSLKGLGTFPNVKNPSVIWAGIDCISGMAGLVNDVEDLCADFNFPREKRPFSPHLTLARVRRGKPAPAELVEYIKGNSETMYGTGIFDTLVLYRSVLTPGGPQYTPLEKITLKDE